MNRVERALALKTPQPVLFHLTLKSLVTTSLTLACAAIWKHLGEGEEAEVHDAEATVSVTLRADVDEEGLRGLLDLNDAGLAVVWPRGFDSITARAYIQEFDNL